MGCHFQKTSNGIYAFFFFVMTQQIYVISLVISCHVNLMLSYVMSYPIISISSLIASQLNAEIPLRELPISHSDIDGFRYRVDDVSNYSMYNLLNIMTPTRSNNQGTPQTRLNTLIFSHDEIR